MASSQQASSTSRPDTPRKKPSHPDAFPQQIDHAPGSEEGRCEVERLHIKVDDGPDGKVTGFLHIPNPYQPGQHNTTAAVLLSGAGGGVTGPSSMYLGIADKLASLPNEQAMLALRLDYRYPARNKYCVPDVEAAVDYLQRERHVEKVVLVGWSFGSAPVLTFSAQNQRVVGAALVAPQTAETEGVYKMPPRPLLLCHGRSDRTLSFACSKNLEASYNAADEQGKGDVKVRLFDGDDHALTRHAAESERLITGFIMRLANVDLTAGVMKVAEADLLPKGKSEKVDLMKKGGDLKDESIE